MTGDVQTKPSRASVREQFATDAGFQEWFEWKLTRLLHVPSHHWSGVHWPELDRDRDLGAAIREFPVSRSTRTPDRLLVLAVPTALSDASRTAGDPLDAAPARLWATDDDAVWIPRHIHRAAGTDDHLVCADGKDLAHPYEGSAPARDGAGTPWVPLIIGLKRFYGFTDYEFAVTYALAAELRSMRDNVELFEHIERTDLDERVLMRALALMISGWTADGQADDSRIRLEHASRTTLETLMLVVRLLKSAREITVEGDAVTLSITLDADPEAESLGLHLSELLSGGSATWLFQTATTTNSSLHLTTSGHVIGVLEHAPFLPAQEGNRFIASLPRTPVPQRSDRATVKNLCVRPPVDYGWAVRRRHITPASSHRSAGPLSGSGRASDATHPHPGEDRSQPECADASPSPAQIAAAFTLHPGKEISVTSTATCVAAHPDATGDEGAEALTGEVFAVQRHGAWSPWSNSAVRRGWNGINQRNGLKLAIMDSLVDASFGPHGALLAAVHQNDPEQIRRLARGLGVTVAEESIDDSAHATEAGARPVPSTSRIWSRRLLDLQDPAQPASQVSLDIRRHLYAGDASTEPLLFQELSRQQRLELLSLDGATIVDIDTGEILAVGAIVNLDEKQEAGGGRASAARSLAKHGVAFKVSQDGAIHGWHHWRGVIQECLFLG
ncbi:hypothetical protein [Brachybacterium timonense]|uniref:hypothetical protein n=1 Tax=Brachybacterium timonense TaxID=2050896 RepID=UPI000D0B9F7F|nr:hypothetical protein [Brachybacterium timonense]